MTTRAWKRTIEAAQDDRFILHQGHVYLRIPYGQEQWWGWESPPQELCRDCGCEPGQLHVTTCDVEECPICQPQQRISCDHWWSTKKEKKAMSDTFFPIVPDNDPVPTYPLLGMSYDDAPEPDEEPGYCIDDICASYTEEEHAAIMQEAQKLSKAFFQALDTYSRKHPGLTYEVILHALDCITDCIHEQMDEAAEDADTDEC